MIKFILIVLSLSASYSFADSNYTKEIEKFAEALVFDKYTQAFEFTEENKLHISASPISERFNLTPCQQPLEGNLVGDKIKQKSSIKVTCNDPIPWSVYVRVQAKTLIPLVTTLRALHKGEVLNDDNMQVIYKDESQVRGSFFSNMDILRGTRLKRNISANKNIQSKYICYVCRDDKVTIIANKTGLVIKASGIALSDGNIGSTVKVKNMRTQRVIIGTVHALKEVHVSF